MRTTLLLVLVLLTTACFSDSSDPPIDPIDPAGAHHTYIVDSITLPTTSAEAIESALDLDGDGSVDNVVGQIIAVIAGLGNDYGAQMNAEIADRITAGQLIHLFDVQARALDNADRVGWYSYLGADPDGDASDNWPGPETYTAPVPGTPGVGQIVDGVLDARDGELPLALVLPNVSETIVFDLRAATIVADITAGSLDGVIAGALPEDDIDRVLLPALQLGLQAVVDDMCGGTTCPPNSLGDRILEYFDTDNDGVIDIDELAGNSLINSLLTPDVDIFDQDGNYNPGVDGEADSLSFAVPVTAVPAVFNVPNAGQ